MTIGFSISTERLLWRALHLVRVHPEPGFLVTIRGGFLRVAITTPELLVVLIEDIQPLPAFTVPDQLDLVLARGPFAAAMATMLATRRSQRRRADLVWMFDEHDRVVRLRCGGDFAVVPLVTTVPFTRYDDQQLANAIGGPHLPNLNSYAAAHIGLLRSLLEPVGIRPRLSTSVPELRSELTNLGRMSAEEMGQHLDRAADVVRRSPGVYLDRHLMFRVVPDPSGVFPPADNSFDVDPEPTPEPDELDP